MFSPWYSITAAIKKNVLTTSLQFRKASQKIITIYHNIAPPLTTGLLQLWQAKVIPLRVLRIDRDELTDTALLPALRLDFMEWQVAKCSSSDWRNSSSNLFTTGKSGMYIVVPNNCITAATRTTKLYSSALYTIDTKIYQLEQRIFQQNSDGSMASTNNNLLILDDLPNGRTRVPTELHGRVHGQTQSK